MMPMHITWTGVGLFHQWHPFRGPLIAIATALVLALLGRFLRIQLLAVAAGGAGVVAGWYAITGALWVMPPPVTVDVLTGIAAGALIIGLLAVRLGPGPGAMAALLVAGVLAGWWLAGAPRHLARCMRAGRLRLGVGVATMLFIRVVATGESQPLRLALSGLTHGGVASRRWRFARMGATRFGARRGRAGNADGTADAGHWRPAGGPRHRRRRQHGRGDVGTPAAPWRSALSISPCCHRCWRFGWPRTLLPACGLADGPRHWSPA